MGVGSCVWLFSGLLGMCRELEGREACIRYWKWRNVILTLEDAETRAGLDTFTPLSLSANASVEMK